MLSVVRPLLVLAAVLAVPLAAAQTFTVTVASKTADHPYSGQGNGNGYVVDGVQGAELTLVRGRTYTFQMSGVSGAHPFYVSTSEVGGGAGAWTDGVSGNGATGNAEVTFTVPASAPDLLWYQCLNHSFMGWRLTIVSATDVADETPSSVFSLETGNPSAGGSAFSLVPAQAGAGRVEVFAADGRRVAVLLDGPVVAGVSRRVTLPQLAAGVYVVRATVGDWQAERRVTVVR